MIFLVGLLCAATADDPEISWTSTQLVPGIHMLAGEGGFAGGNLTLVVGREGVALIDDGIEGLSAMTLATVKEQVGKPIDFVVNTHIHGDHMGGNKAMQDAGATVITHDKLRERLVKEGWPTRDGSRPLQPGELPVLTFSDKVTLHLGDHTARIFHVEHAHTDGDALVHFPEAKVLSTGDVFFNGMFPYIDGDSGGSVAGVIAALEQIYALVDDETKIVPGHGPVGAKADVKRSLEMIRDADARVRALVAEGKSEDEVVAANPLQDYHEAWNWSFITTEKMTRQLYSSAAAAKK